MITSALNSVNITNPKPMPWGWNPAATFMTALYDAQENNRAQERFAMEAELNRILLPEKMAKAEFSIKKLAYDSKLLELSHRAETADLDNRMRVIASGGRSAASGPDGGQTDEDPTSFNLTGTSYDRKTAAQSQPGSQPMARKPVVDLTGL